MTRESTTRSSITAEEPPNYVFSTSSYHRHAHLLSVRKFYRDPISQAQEEMRVFAWDGETPCRAVLYGPEDGSLREIEFALAS